MWNSADAYLFDIDGTLINSRDAVHYFAFRNALRSVYGIEASIEGVPVHGNTDIGILRAVLQRAGLADAEIEANLSQAVEFMCNDVRKNQEQLSPEVCPGIPELLSRLQRSGKVLGAASGNLEPIGWLKLEKAGLREFFSLGTFSFPLEEREDIFRRGIRMIRDKLGSQAVVCVVGDTPADIRAARATECPVVALATGIYGYDELRVLNPDACLKCASDLLNG